MTTTTHTCACVITVGAYSQCISPQGHVLLRKVGQLLRGGARAGAYQLKHKDRLALQEGNTSGLVQFLAMEGDSVATRSGCQ
jgi:hypothetical protein